MAKVVIVVVSMVVIPAEDNVVVVVATIADMNNGKGKTLRGKSHEHYV